MPQWAAIKAYVYVAILVVVIGAASGVAFKVGCWYQAAADHKEVKEAQDALTANANAVASAEKAGREEAAKIYKEEIATLKARAEYSAKLAESLRSDNKFIQEKYARAKRSIEEKNREPDVEAFLATPIPAALRDGLLKQLADPTDAASGGGN